MSIQWLHFDTSENRGVRKTSSRVNLKQTYAKFETNFVSWKGSPHFAVDEFEAAKASNSNKEQ
jgi:hypothetical protein